MFPKLVLPDARLSLEWRQLNSGACGTHRMTSRSSVLVTGGAGFIGSHFIRDWLAAESAPIVNLDKLTYAADAGNLREAAGDARYVFVRGDIADPDVVAALLRKHQPGAVVNFAAETHVDRSIREAADFVQTNVAGTFRLLDAVRAYWQGMEAGARNSFRFLHVSTDEVYGSLAAGEPPFRETTPYAPNNPYSASKASSDHLVRAWHQTHGLPAVTINCSNNYGPRQNTEKFVPLLITRALASRRLPIYGDGANVRDWIYVRDACAALRLALAKGEAGQTYNLGTGIGTSNVEMARGICSMLDELRPMAGGRHHESLIEFVADRPGHDRRYVVDSSRLRSLTGWKPEESLESGLRKTVVSYLEACGYAT